MILTIISWLLNEPLKVKIEQFKKNKMIWVFALPFFFYLLGMIYSDNHAFGWADVELKLSLLVFPIIFGSTSFPFWKYRNNLALVFIYSSAFWGLLSIVCGAVEFQQIPIYGMMNLLLHPSYLALYMNVAIILTFFLLIQDKLRLPSKKLLLFALLILSISVWLGLSKSGILVWCLLVFGFVFYKLIIHKQLLKSTYLILLCAIALTLAVMFIPHLKDRFKSFSTVSMDLAHVDRSTTESTQVRLLVWNQALELIQENPLIGTGTGDIKDELIVKYEAAGMTGAMENKLNVHNQYLQVFATLGVFGFLAFLMAFVLPTIKSIKEKHWVYLVFLTVFLLNLLSESMWEKQDGMVFYAFLNALLFFHFQPNEQNRYKTEN